MFHPLSLFVGLRYARARTHKFFVSFITWVSLLGVAVGVAALIVILSVMNGFESELRGRLLSLSSPLRIERAAGDVPDWQQVGQSVAAVKGITSVSRYAELQVLAVRQPEMLPLVLRGVGGAGATELARLVVEGDPAVLEKTPDQLVLGRLVAEQLGIVVGDAVTLLVPTLIKGGVPEGRLREFQVGALFEAGIQDHDATLAFASLATLDSLGAERSGSSGLAIHVEDPMRAPALAQTVAARLPSLPATTLRVRDWTQDHASYFRAIRIEKTMMALILMLVVAIAAFNIVAMLVMVVADKRTDIAILRTLGAGPGRVATVFVTQGLIVGWAGVLLGVASGVLVSLHVSSLLQALESVFRFHVFDADVFYITRIPSEPHTLDVLLIALCGLALTALATLYPALRAAATPPAEALRYE
jgi:lipoprotein-releasing system permease protein